MKYQVRIRPGRSYLASSNVPRSELINIVGYLAAFLTTISFIPQAVKVVRERQTAGISLHMYLLFTGGVFFWLIYGVLISSAPILAANTITFLLAATVLVVKLRNG